MDPAPSYRTCRGAPHFRLHIRQTTVCVVRKRHITHCCPDDRVVQGGLGAVHVPYSYGWSIIALTALVKLMTYPFTKIQVPPPPALTHPSRPINPAASAIRPFMTGVLRE